MDLLPGLRDDGRGFQQHAEQAERRVDLHRVLGLDPPALRHEAVDLLDAALGVLAVAAHVPFADRAVRARHRVGTPDDADDQVALAERAGRTRVDDAAERLVAEHKPRLARRRPAVLAFDDLDVGPAHADCDRLDEHGPVARVGLWDVIEAGAPRVRGRTVMAFKKVNPFRECRTTLLLGLELSDFDGGKICRTMSISRKLVRRPNETPKRATQTRRQTMRVMVFAESH